MSKPADQSAAHAHTVGQNQLHKFSSDLHTSAPHTNAHRPLFTNTCLCKCSLIRAHTHVHIHTGKKNHTLPQLEVFGTTFFLLFAIFQKSMPSTAGKQAGRKGRKGETCNFPTSPTLGQSPVVSTGTVVRGFLIPHRPHGKFGSSRICYKPQT